MYSSCLACHRDLGSNSAIERFSVGRAIAFAPADGRLWAICVHCGEWNLAPIEDRWEAIARCQEVYDSTIERVRLDQMSVARTNGLDLVRVGEGDELPTLRYGDRLRDRHRSRQLRTRIAHLTQVMFLLGTVTMGALVGGFSGAFIASLLGFVAFEIASNLVDPVVARVPLDDGSWTEVTRHDLREMRLRPEGDDGWVLRVRKGLELTGDSALQALRLVLPLVTSSDDAALNIRRALRYVDKKGGALDSVFGAAARRRGIKRSARIAKLDPHIRLALEVLASEEVEERAIAGDLGHLESAWKNADELAEIQDDLVFSMRIVERLRAAGG